MWWPMPIPMPIWLPEGLKFCWAKVEPDWPLVPVPLVPGT